jgi:ribosomal protein S18 acetylase RimI-like enzyme
VSQGAPRPTPSRRHPSPARDRQALLALFGRDRDAHPYGIADLEQLWHRSRWWRREDAVVGLLELPGATLPVGYAIAAREPAATLDLLADVGAVDLLPAAFVITGPPGLSHRLAGWYHAHRSSDYLKMALPPSATIPAPDPRVRTLTPVDLPGLQALYATDPAAGDFFHPGLLATGCYLGVEVAGELVASAGVHVLDPVNGVAAIGNVATTPAYRGRGLGRLVTAAVCHRLRGQVHTIGLNVAPDNLAALSLYRRLGFVEVLAFEEAELKHR